MIEAGERAAQITSQLLAFSRQQSQRPEPVDLNALVRRTSRMLSRLIGEHISLDLRLESGIAPVDADRAQLEQVILNLVINARDAMSDGGQVVISTRNSRADDARHMEAGADPLGYVVLTVRDTGEGMDEETRTQVFEPFYTTKEHGRGTGLGLAMVYGVVKQGGGHISVTSAPGEGSQFDLFFPVASREACQECSAAPRTPEGRAAGRILLVEDEESIRDLAARVLRGRGYEVIEAHDGMEALERVGDDSALVDLLVTDVVMPRLSGMKLAARLRQAQPRLPVVFMSGYAQAGFDVSGMTTGLDEFLQKPFTPDLLLASARRAAAGGAGQRRLGRGPKS